MKRFLVVMGLLLVVVLAVACPAENISQADYISEDSILATVGVQLENFKIFIEDSRDRLVDVLFQDDEKILNNQKQIQLIEERLDKIEKNYEEIIKDNERVEGLEEELQALRKMLEEEKGMDLNTEENNLQSDDKSKETLVELYPNLEEHQFFTLEEIDAMVNFLVVGTYGDIVETIKNGEEFSIDDEDRLKLIYFMLKEVPLEYLNEQYEFNVENRDELFDYEDKMKESYLKAISEKLFDKVLENDKSVYGSFYGLDMPMEIEIENIEPLTKGLRVYFVMNAYVEDKYKGQVDLNVEAYPLYSNFLVEKIDPAGEDNIQDESLNQEEKREKASDENAETNSNTHQDIAKENYKLLEGDIIYQESNDNDSVDSKNEMILESGINHKVNYHILNKDIEFVEYLFPVTKIIVDEESKRLYFVTTENINNGEKKRSFMMDLEEEAIYFLGDGVVLGFLKGKIYDDYSIVFDENSDEKEYNVYNPYGHFESTLEENLDAIIQESDHNQKLVKEIFSNN